MPRVLISTGGGDPANYLAAVAAAGGEGTAAYLPAGDGGWDGLLLAGGGDPDPALFGRKNRGSRDIDRARDRAELALLDAFLGAGKPVLAVCRGHQLANIWAGGTLLQDLGAVRGAFHRWDGADRLHPVRAAPGSLLYRLYGPLFTVNSAHHQALGRLGRGIRATAWSESGVVEGLEHERLPLVGVQFHPERLTGALARPGAVDGGAVFERFLRRCEG